MSWTAPERPCVYCGTVLDLDSLLFVPGVLDPDNPLASLLGLEGSPSVVSACPECAERLGLEETDTYRALRETVRDAIGEGEVVESVAAQGEMRETVDDETEAGSSPEETERLAADAPPGETYGAKQAAQVLGVSARRVSQLAQDGRLQVVQERPLRLSAQSVHELRAERKSAGGPVRGNTPPESVAEQVERLVSLVTAETRKAIEAQEHLLGEVSAQRDDLRSEVERLRLQVERERARADELAERLTAPAVVEDAPVRRKWWQR